MTYKTYYDIRIQIRLTELRISHQKSFYSLRINRIYHIKECEGCFCDSATWRVEGNHDVDLSLEMGVVKPKTQIEGPKFDPRASGTSSKKILKSRDCKARIK